MGRKNIFELFEENDDLEKKAERLDSYFCKLTLVTSGIPFRYTLENFIKNCCFDCWKNKKHCIDLDDFLDVIDYADIYNEAQCELNDFLTLMEVILNFVILAEKVIDTNPDLYSRTENFEKLHVLLSDYLKEYNQKAWYNEEKEQVIVVEDKPEVTAVAEIVEAEDALSIIRYNHHALKGDIKAKKHILVEIGKKLEPERNRLHTINSSLEDKIFFMLNNMDLRHNNRCEGDKNYKPVVAQMTDEDLEYWYDELYQMMLLAFLELDQSERNRKVDTLKATINGGAT